MVAAPAYVPRRGDVVWLTFNPQAGHEQAGRRPAVVLSPNAYNAKVGLALLCPITSQVKGYPFEVLLPHGLPVSGAILADQIKSLDWQARLSGIPLRFATSDRKRRTPKNRRVIVGIAPLYPALVGDAAIRVVRRHGRRVSFCGSGACAGPKTGFQRTGRAARFFGTRWPHIVDTLACGY